MCIRDRLLTVIFIGWVREREMWSVYGKVAAQNVLPHKVVSLFAGEQMWISCGSKMSNWQNSQKCLNVRNENDTLKEFSVQRSLICKMSVTLKNSNTCRGKTPDIY